MFNLTKSFNKTIMRKKLLFRSWLLLALMLVGAGSAWGATRLVNLRSWDFTTVTWNGSEVDNSQSITINKAGCTYCTGALSGIALQGADKWVKRDAGLYNDNNGGRNVAVLGLKAGDIVTVVTNDAISGLVNGENTNGTLTGTCTFSVNSDGAFGFTYPRNKYISSITVQREEYYEASKTWDFVNSGYTTANLPSDIDGLTINGNIANQGDFTIQNGLRFRTNGGSVNVPVTAGQIVTFGGGTYDNSERHGMTIYLTNSVDGSGNALTTGSIDDGGEFSCIAASDGVVTLTRGTGGNSNYLTIPYITVYDPVAFNYAACEAELIDLDINEPTICCPANSEVTYSVSNTKIAKLGGEEHSGDLMGINTGITGVNATVKYNNLTITASYTLTISADEATYVVEGNTYTLTGPGKLGERVVNAVPKMVMEFGENKDNITNITIVREQEGTVATTLDENGWQQLWYDGTNGTVLPYQGTFYTFKPTANGKLTVTGYLRGANSVYLVDADNLAHLPSNLTAQVGKSAANWTNAIGVAGTGVAPAVNIDGTDYPMVERYEGTISTTGDIIYQTVTGLADGHYSVVLQANACFTDREAVARPEGWTWNASQAANIVNIFVESGGNRQTKAMNALNATSVPFNGRYTFEVDVTGGTLTMGINKTAIGTNWHTIQIESLSYLDADGSHFEPVWSYAPDASFVNNQEVDVETMLEAGKTYYLYANIPSSNGVNAWGTYQLKSFSYESSWSFANSSIVIDFDDVTNYNGMEIVKVLPELTPSLTYSAEFKGDITGEIDSATGKITSISATGDDANKGGAIVVTATDGTDSDYYVITVPYATKLWDFWGIPTRGGKSPTDLNTEDFDWAMNYEVRTYEDATRNLVYLNEPVFTAAQAVEGDNAAFIGETAGLVVNTPARKFGLRAEVDNLGDYNKFKEFFLDGGANQAKYAEYIETYGLDQDDFTAAKFAELKGDGNFVDRYLKIMLAYDQDDVHNTNFIAMENGAVITIPNVKAGSYIALKWYRHAPNSGDKIKVTNAVDLDGTSITNGVYVINQGRSGSNIPGNPYGWIEFRAAADGDVTLQVDDIGWTHIKAIALSENEFYDTDLVIRDDKIDNTATTAFNTTDGNVSNTYSRESYYTKSEQGMSYTYTLKDMTGTVNATSVTIDGGTLTAAQGTVGTATLVLTCYSNGYAIDRQEIALKFGAYGDTHQDYPYTWNFTNIIASNLDGQSNWTKDGDNYTVTPTATTAHLQDNELKKSSTDEDGVAEFDELGIETPTNPDGTSTAIDLTITDNGDGTTTTTVGDTGITLVVPDVPADATVYVKVVPNNNSTVNISNGDGETTPTQTTLDDGTTVYTIDGTTDENNVLVELKNIEVQSIAVTNIFKEARMASASDGTKFYNSDCQPKVIDYSLTEYYTGYEMHAMYITSDNFSEFNTDRETAVVTPVEVESPVPAKTGLIVYTSDNEVLHPLFVPDVNTTARQDVTGNMLVGVLFDENTGTGSTETLYKADPATGELVKTEVTIYTGNVTPAENDTYRYLFTNQYNTVGQNNSLTSDEPGFYRLKEAGGKLKSNRAYLVIGQNVLKGNSVKAVYLKSFFNDDPDDDFSTVIELVEGNNAGIDMNGTFYTISGVKIQGMPTKSGIYIQNGKKIMVK